MSSLRRPAPEPAARGFVHDAFSSARNDGYLVGLEIVVFRLDRATDDFAADHDGVASLVMIAEAEMPCLEHLLHSISH